MMQKLTLFISCLILLPMLIGFGCDGSERPGERSYDEPIGSAVSSAGFYVLKAGGGKAFSWGTNKALDHFWGGGEADDAEAIQSSLTQIYNDTEAIKESLKSLKGQIAYTNWQLKLALISDNTKNIRSDWDLYQDYLGINPDNGKPREGGPEKPSKTYWEKIVAHDKNGVREQMRQLRRYITDAPFEADHEGLLEACAKYLLDKNARALRTPATLDNMIAYLEQTFLELVDYQCRGFILYREAYQVLKEMDEKAISGKQSPEEYLDEDLRPAIQSQAFEFLRCAELLLVDHINLSADAGPHGTGEMKVPEHWLYAGIDSEYLRVFPRGGKEMLERAALTTVKVLSYVDEQFINMREKEEKIFIVHVIGDPKSVAQAPDTYLSQYLTIPSDATFDGTLLPMNSFTSLPDEFDESLSDEFDENFRDGLRIGSTQYIQFYRRKMSTLPEEFTSDDNTSENRTKLKLYVGFKEAKSIDSAAYVVTGIRPIDWHDDWHDDWPDGWKVQSKEILSPENSELGNDSIEFGHVLYSARPIGSYLGFARSVQDLHLIDSNLYKDYKQKVVRTLPEFGPPVASRSMPEWSSAGCNMIEGYHQCRARWLYKYGLKCHLDYSGEGSFTMNLQPAVLVDHPTRYDRVMIDAVRLDSKQKTADGSLYVANKYRSLDFSDVSPRDRFKSITLEVISESKSGIGCHNEFEPNQQMSLQSLSIVRPKPE